MTRYNRHDGLLPAPTCCGLVVNLLRGSRQLVTDLCKESGVMDFVGRWPVQSVGTIFVLFVLILCRCIGYCLLCSAVRCPC